MKTKFLPRTLPPELKAAGYDLEKLSQEVAGIFKLKPEGFHSKGKYPKLVQVRSLFCYWSVKRGEKLARNKGFELEQVRRL